MRNKITKMFMTAATSTVLCLPARAEVTSPELLHSVCWNVYAGDAAGKYDVQKALDGREFIQTEEVGCIYSEGVGGKPLVTGTFDLTRDDQALEFLYRWREANGDVDRQCPALKL